MKKSVSQSSLPSLGTFIGYSRLDVHSLVTLSEICCFVPHIYVKYSEYQTAHRPMAHTTMATHDNFEELQPVHGDVIILRLSSGTSSVCKPICHSVTKPSRHTFMEGAREPWIQAHEQRKTSGSFLWMCFVVQLQYHMPLVHIRSHAHLSCLCLCQPLGLMFNIK